MRHEVIEESLEVQINYLLSVEVTADYVGGGVDFSESLKLSR